MHKETRDKICTHLREAAKLLRNEDAAEHAFSFHLADVAEEVDYDVEALDRDQGDAYMAACNIVSLWPKELICQRVGCLLDELVESMQGVYGQGLFVPWQEKWESDAGEEKDRAEHLDSLFEVSPIASCVEIRDESEAADVRRDRTLRIELIKAALGGLAAKEYPPHVLARKAVNLADATLAKLQGEKRI